MPKFIKSSLTACAAALVLTLSAQAPAAAEPQQLPEACHNGPTFVRNGIPYANKCVMRGYSYGRTRCVRWIPVACGGGFVNRRS
jgi:hypothetical protein